MHCRQAVNHPIGVAVDLVQRILLILERQEIEERALGAIGICCREGCQEVSHAHAITVGMSWTQPSMGHDGTAVGLIHELDRRRAVDKSLLWEIWAPTQLAPCLQMP